MSYAITTQPQPGVVVMTTPVAQTTWSSGLFGCFENIGSCLFGYFCPCCLSMLIARDEGESMAVPCCVQGGMIALRTKMRIQNNIGVIFALVPPPSILGGWLSFFVSFIMIFGITAIVGDLASIFGCLIGLNDTVTAITLVSLGTSLPDLFASKQAALHERHADNAIGNITGSNSVNVFLGLGFPWLIATIYWTAKVPYLNNCYYVISGYNTCGYNAGMLGWCCPALLALAIAKDAGESYLVPCWVPGGMIAIRTKMRTQYNIEGSICNDCIMLNFCGICVQCQMRRHQKHLKRGVVYSRPS